MGKKLSVLSKRRGKIQKKGVIASFYNSSQRMEYDSNSLMGICSSVAVLLFILSKKENLTVQKKNFYKVEELDRVSTCAKNAHVPFGKLR